MGRSLARTWLLFEVSVWESDGWLLQTGLPSKH